MRTANLSGTAEELDGAMRVGGSTTTAIPFLPGAWAMWSGTATPAVTSTLAKPGLSRRSMRQWR
jgi:hypothetical protein